MTRGTAAKVIWGGVIAALGVVLGLATAPLLVPVLEKLIFHDGSNADLAIASFFGGAGAGGWQGYLATTASTLEGFCLLTLWCAVAIAILGTYVAWNEYGKKGRMVRNGVLGDSRLISSTRELRQKNDFWDGKGAPEKAGLVISGSKKGYLFDSSVPHWAVVGRTGSGKSQLMVLETLHSCMAAAWNLIITGKDELLELTGDTARELGYHRVVFDLKGYPAASHFNPLDLIVEFACDGQIDLAQRTARQTAADLIPLGGEANTYFPQSRALGAYRVPPHRRFGGYPQKPEEHSNCLPPGEPRHDRRGQGPLGSAQGLHPQRRDRPRPSGLRPRRRLPLGRRRHDGRQERAFYT